MNRNFADIFSGEMRYAITTSGSDARGACIVSLC